MMGLFARLKTGVLAALVLVAALFGVHWAGRRKGADEARAKREQDDLAKMAEAHTQIKDVQNEVNKMSDSDVVDRLRAKWMRKKD